MDMQAPLLHSDYQRRKSAQVSDNMSSTQHSNRHLMQQNMERDRAYSNSTAFENLRGENANYERSGTKIRGGSVMF